MCHDPSYTVQCIDTVESEKKIKLLSTGQTGTMSANIYDSKDSKDSIDLKELLVDFTTLDLQSIPHLLPDETYAYSFIVSHDNETNVLLENSSLAAETAKVSSYLSM